MTTPSFSDDTLTLYYYGDGLDADERRDIAAALADDNALRQRFEALKAELDALPDPDVTPPSAETVARWQAAFDDAAGREPHATAGHRFGPFSFLVGVAVAGALALGIGIGSFLDSPTDGTLDIVNPGPGDVVQPAASAAPGSFVRGLAVHFRDSRDELVSLADLPVEARRASLTGLQAQNRLYRRAAQGNETEKFARVLRAFDLVLEELATGELSTDEAEALRSKMLFELDVMLTKLRQEPSERQDII